VQALKLPAARGWRWIVEGFRLFRRNPPLMTFLVFGYLFLLFLIDLVPLVGPAAASICMPALSMGVMNGCRALDRRAPVSFGVLVSGFQQNTRVLVALGGIYLGATLGILALTMLLDDGELSRIMREGKPMDAETLGNSQLLMAVQIALVLMIPLLMAFWFAPMLAAWNGCSVAKSLFFSFVACWRNWPAFLVYGLGVAGVSIAVPGAVLAIAAVFAPQTPRFLAALLTAPLLFLFAPTLFGSFYVSYRDVFVADAVDDRAE